MGSVSVTVQQLLQNFDMFSVGAYLGPDWTPDQIVECEKKAKTFFEQVGLLPTQNDEVFCNRCTFPPTERPRCYAVRQNSRIGFLWKCPSCSQRVSPLKNTWFDKCKLDYRKMLKMLTGWIIGMSVTTTISQAKVSSESAVQWYSFVRQAISVVAMHDFEMIGGKGDVVEIDESHIFKRKYNVGRVLRSEQHWAFGGISRLTRKRCVVLKCKFMRRLIRFYVFIYVQFQICATRK